jgi:hypothetical protein
MQTITKDKSSCYLYDDSEIINIQKDSVVIGNPPTLIIGDINIHNGQVYKNVTPPDDWKGNKYLFDGKTWELNPDFPPPKVYIQPNVTGMETF